MFNVIKNKLLATTIITLCSLPLADTWATIPYGGVTPGIPSGLDDTSIAIPSIVSGKEYSHDLDMNITPAPDPEQVIAWDGSGGVADGLDFSLTRATAPTGDSQFDAIAFHRDHLFKQVLDNTAHLIFSFDNTFTPYIFSSPSPATFASSGPVVTTGGNMIGGAGELSFETPTGFTGIWASQADINGMPLPVDVDGVELWGPEPAIVADTDKYSLDTDTLGGSITPTSIWNGSGSPYISHATIVATVKTLLTPFGPEPSGIDPEINVDALMVDDRFGDPDMFEDDTAGGLHDRILFSIRQIFNPADPDGYYATGSEIFFLSADGSASFLTHGGHTWNHSYTLSSAFEVLGGTSPTDNAYGILDLNALEAVGSGVVVPEPSIYALLGTMLAMAAVRRQPRSTA